MLASGVARQEGGGAVGELGVLLGVDNVGVVERQLLQEYQTSMLFTILYLGQVSPQ